MQPADTIINPNFRRFRAVIAVANTGGISRAAEQIHRSQPAVTRAVLELEAELAFPIFERSRQGMVATAIGEVVLGRIRSAMEQIMAADADLPQARLLEQAVSHRQLQVLISIAEQQNETGAAEALRLTQPAITRSLRNLENVAGSALFYRTSRRMILTDHGERLLRRAKLALGELALIGSDLAAHLGRINGHVTIGALPLSGTLLVPRSVNRLLARHPRLQVTIREGSYAALLAALRCGEIDLIVGALRDPPPALDVLQEALFEDTLAVVARAGHPLGKNRPLALRDLCQADWVIPHRETPARARFEQAFREAGLALPAHTVETGALVTIRALLLESDRLAAVSPLQMRFEIDSGMLALLPVDLGNTSRVIGMTTRADVEPSAAVRYLIGQLHEVSGELTRVP
ncbi:MAG: LysR family transcriptional regulator [Pseudomonadota bacterium]